GIPASFLRAGIVMRQALLEWPENFNQLFSRPTAVAVRCCTDNTVRNAPFLCEEFINPLFQGIGDQYAIDVHCLILPDTMDTIRCLIFDCRIPPTVGMDNVISTG